MTFASDVLAIERDGPVATLWLDRPEKRNAMGPAFWRDMPAAIADLEDDGQSRVVILAARGKSFSVGLDLTAMGGTISGGTISGDTTSGDTDGPGAADGDGQGADSVATRNLAGYRMIRRMQRAASSIADCALPVIAAVHSHCIGGAIDIISAADIRLASADALFSVRETKVAIVADMGTLQRLPRIIAAGHVAELAYTGKDISAERAAQIGLVNDVFDDYDALLAGARALASEIAANSPIAVQGTKAVLRAAQDQTVEQSLDYVALWNTGFLQSRDLTEAMMAFLEKRDPTFTGT